ncbi:hypothetical protein L6250_02290 [Candidatus Parcubacteria bacterium]|nr:hypothetical protein [Patescibacteria group bacterium]MBU4467039.1 hypothetical protein [Patescibacteria group bacterium]MCG2688445.1 hypothetical protein [Candidatus Parcubacteria bacterium]
MTGILSQNIILLWLYWHFVEAPKQIFRGWMNILVFNWNYFSVTLLFKTLFAYWHQYRWHYPRGFDIGKYLEVFFSNMISRILGAIMRTFMIFFGIIVQFGILIIGLAALITWLAMPLLIVLGILKGTSLLF